MATTSAAAAANTEFDLVLKKMIMLLHSNSPTSATELRHILDEQIKQRHGADKMLCNTLSQRHLDYEKTFPGVITTPPPHEISDEIINLTNSPKTISDSPETLDSDDGVTTVGATTVSDAVNLLAADSEGEDDTNLKEFGDLNCCVCGEMMFTATNRLIECSVCGALYHQECHKPCITEEEAMENPDNTWRCHGCSSKTVITKPTSSNTAPIVIEDDPVTLSAISTPKDESDKHSTSTSSSSSRHKKHSKHSSRRRSTDKEHKKTSSSHGTESGSSRKRR